MVNKQACKSLKHLLRHISVHQEYRHGLRRSYSQVPEVWNQGITWASFLYLFPGLLPNSCDCGHHLVVWVVGLSQRLLCFLRPCVIPRNVAVSQTYPQYDTFFFKVSRKITPVSQGLSCNECNQVVTFLSPFLYSTGQ